MNKRFFFHPTLALWLVWLVVMVLCSGGCQAAKHASPQAGFVPRLDSVDLPHPPTPRRLLGLLPPRKAPRPVVLPAGTSIRKVGKRATIIFQQGTGNTVALTGKKGQSIQADSGATVQAAQSQAGPSAAAGEDADLKQMKEHWLRAVVPWVIGIAGLALIVAAVRRRFFPV